MCNLAVQPDKIRFGSPEFMFMRTDLDKMMRERNRLKIGSRERYEINKERVDFLQNTIVAIAGRVYFERKPRKKVEVVSDAPIPYVRKKEKQKKARPRKIVDENQQKFF